MSIKTSSAISTDEIDSGVDERTSDSQKYWAYLYGGYRAYLYRRGHGDDCGRCVALVETAADASEITFKIGWNTHIHYVLKKEEPEVK